MNKRIYYHYEKLEEFHAGMWKKLPPDKEKDLLEKAIHFTGNAELYGEWMRTVCESWKFSCEHNLTDTSQNRKAWLGHAATCLAIGAPEHITRAAWWHLTQTQQDEANQKAKEAIEQWEAKAFRQRGLFDGL